MNLPAAMPMRAAQEGIGRKVASGPNTQDGLSPADTACEIACEAARVAGLALCSGPWYPLCAAGVEAAYQRG
jgi:hypothetical protein